MSTIKFSQSIVCANDSSISINFDFEGAETLSKIVGTSCNELFELIDLQSKGVSKLFKLSQPIDITIEGEDFKIDTTKISAILRTKLKLNKTSDSKRRFAKRVYSLVNYVHRERKIVSIEEIEELFND